MKWGEAHSILLFLALQPPRSLRQSDTCFNTRNCKDCVLIPHPTRNIALFAKLQLLSETFKQQHSIDFSSTNSCVISYSFHYAKDILTNYRSNHLGNISGLDLTGGNSVSVVSGSSGQHVLTM